MKIKISHESDDIASEIEKVFEGKNFIDIITGNALALSKFIKCCVKPDTLDLFLDQFILDIKVMLKNNDIESQG
jgi:hypothetical protein